MAALATGVTVKEVPTTKIDGQKTGTSGLRKKAAEFSQGNYLANWVQSLFNALPAEQRVRGARAGAALCCAGDAWAEESSPFSLVAPLRYRA